MLVYRDVISYEDTMDPMACNLPESNPEWKRMSRDPQSTVYKKIYCLKFFI